MNSMQEIKATVIICPNCSKSMDAKDVLAIPDGPSDDYRNGWLDAIEEMASMYKDKRDKYIACRSTKETGQYLKYNRIYTEICENSDFQSVQAKIIDRQSAE